MSAIRPHLPPPTGPMAPPTPAPARAAQAAFFQAALQGVSPPAERPAPTRASEPREASAERSMRPGALLDIRV